MQNGSITSTKYLNYINHAYKVYINFPFHILLFARYYPGNPLLQYTALPPIEGPPHNKWGVPLFSMLGIVFGIVLLTGSITIFELYRWHILLRGEYAIAPGKPVNLHPTFCVI